MTLVVPKASFIERENDHFPIYYPLQPSKPSKPWPWSWSVAICLTARSRSFLVIPSAALNVTTRGILISDLASDSQFLGGHRRFLHKTAQQRSSWPFLWNRPGIKRIHVLPDFFVRLTYVARRYLHLYLFSDVMWTMFSLCVFLYLSLNEWTCISDKKRNSTFYLPSSPILYMEWFIEHMSNPQNFHQIFEIFALHIQTYLSRSTSVLLTSYDYS